MTKYLNNVNYVKHLQGIFFIGELDPWRKDDEGNSYFALLVPLDTALQECKDWSDQDLGRKEFVDYLKLNNVWVVKNIEEFQKIKETRENERQIAREEKKNSRRRNLTQEQRKALSERMSLLNKSKNTPSAEIPSNLL